jgi:hypothetical protein
VKSNNVVARLVEVAEAVVVRFSTALRAGADDIRFGFAIPLDLLDGEGKGW